MIPYTPRCSFSLFQSCARLRKESRRCLSHSKKLTADRADVVKGLKEQLDALHVSEGFTEGVSGSFAFYRVKELQLRLRMSEFH